MNFTPLLIATLLVLPAIGGLLWIWYCMAQASRQLRSLSGFDGIHFEIGSTPTEFSPDAR